MKTKLIRLSVALALLWMPVMVQAQVNYAISGTTAYVTNSPSAVGDIVITNIYDGYPVTSIGEGAFFRCSLTSVTIPDSFTNIGDEAFRSCTSLTNVTIPNSVTSIGYGAFGECGSLTNIAVAADNPAYSSVNDVLFDKMQTTLIQFPEGLGGSYAISNSVTSIGNAAFLDCSSLTSVTIPNSVTSIGDYAFDVCSSLTNIAVAVDNLAFSSVKGVLFDKAQATLIQFPAGLGGGYAISNGVTSIGEDAFFDCSSLTSVTIPNSVTSIGDYAFYDCTSLTSAYFQGNAPPDDGMVFYGNGATVYYYYGTSGWSSIYGGLPTVMLGVPALQFGNGSIEAQSGNFGFTLTGVTNQTVIVEASTNLVNWQPVWTNTLSGASANFTDAQWTNYPSRFYRLSSP